MAWPAGPVPPLSAPTCESTHSARRAGMYRCRHGTSFRDGSDNSHQAPRNSTAFASVTETTGGHMSSAERCSRQAWPTRGACRLGSIAIAGWLIGCATAPVEQIRYFAKAYDTVNTVGQPLL